MNPCSQCHGAAYVVSVKVYRHGSRWYSVNCKQCKNTLPRFTDSQVQAEEAWNSLNQQQVGVHRGHYPLYAVPQLGTC